METPLDPNSAVLLAEENVVVSTPGLAGTVEVVPPPPPGESRSGGLDAGPLVAQALAQAQAIEQFTVVLANLQPLDGSGGGESRGGPVDLAGAPTISVEVPAPAVGLGQFAMYVTEDGVVSFHYAQEADEGTPESPSRGAERFTYTVPRALPDPAVPIEAPAESRGFGFALGRKLLKIFVFPLLDPLIKCGSRWIAQKWEAKHTRSGLGLATMPDDAVQVDAITPADWGRLTAGGPILLLLHGTFSTADGAFACLGPTFFLALSAHYGGRVLAFEHPTVTVTPSANAEEFARLLPAGAGPLTMDVIAHSRGGLVAREILRADTPPGFELGKVVMFGTPNDGTALAEFDNLGAWVDRLANLAALLPGAGDTVALVLEVVKQLAVRGASGLSGLIAMQNARLSDLNDAYQPGGTSFFAVASDYEPDDIGPVEKAVDALLDGVFSAANDTVVPTVGVAAIASRPDFAPTAYTVEPGIEHSQYFAHPECRRRLAGWLEVPWPSA